MDPLGKGVPFCPFAFLFGVPLILTPLPEDLDSIAPLLLQEKSRPKSRGEEAGNRFSPKNPMCVLLFPAFVCA